MDAELKAAAEAGNVDLLYTSIKGKPSLLDQIDKEPFVETPLHLAASLGHTQFTMEIMGLRPSFSRKLDLDGFTPLHLALKKEKIYTVERLVGVESDLVRVRGRGGITPLHIVVEKENIELLKKFLSVCPESIQDVTIRGETALHLAVKNKKFLAFDFLVKGLERANLEGYDFLKKQILNLTDDEGNSLLHIAALTKQPKVIKLLLSYGVQVNAKNFNGLTALGIAERQQGADNIKVKKLLRNRSTVFLKALGRLKNIVSFIFSSSNMTEERRNALLIVTTLIVTTTYQAALSPPGGLWQDDGKTSNDTSSTFYQIPPNNPSTFNTGHPIREETSPQIPGRVIITKKDFSSFWILNTVTLYSTIFCICLALPDFNSFTGMYLYMPLGFLVACYESALSAILRDVMGGFHVLNFILPLFILIIICGKILKTI